MISWTLTFFAVALLAAGLGATLDEPAMNFGLGVVFLTAMGTALLTYLDFLAEERASEGEE